MEGNVQDMAGWIARQQAPLRSRAVARPFGLGIYLIALLLLILLLPDALPVSLTTALMLGACLAFSDLALIIPVGTTGGVSLATTFVFALFLLEGALAAAAIHGAAFLLGQLLARQFPRVYSRASLRFVAFNAGQVVLSALGAGAICRYLLNLPLDQGAASPLTLLMFAPAYWLINSALVVLAVQSRLGWKAIREDLWPGALRWSGVSLLFTVPLGVLVATLSAQLGVPLTATLIFGWLAALSTIFRLELRLRERNLALAESKAELETLLTRNAALQARLAHEAATDPLTGVRNRRYFDRVLAREIALANRVHAPIGLLLLDLDHFKQINDLYGHPVGDTVLRGLAHALASHTRTSDVIARLGGEEFAILLPDTDAAGAAVVAEKLRWTIADWPAAGESGEPFNVTVSVGIAVAARGQATPRALLSAADRALYRAKQRGRNRVETEHLVYGVRPVRLPESAREDSAPPFAM